MKSNELIGKKKGEEDRPTQESVLWQQHVLNQEEALQRICEYEQIDWVRLRHLYVRAYFGKTNMLMKSHYGIFHDHSFLSP